VNASPVIYASDEAFTVGGLKVVRASSRDRLVLVGAGVTLHEALAAHDELAAGGIAVRVVDLYSVKPVDAAALTASVGEAGNVVLTVEDHYAEGGIGDAVRAALAGSRAVVHSLAVREIPRSGTPRKLLERFGIGRGGIVARVRELVGSA
jgi:transketolase